MSAYVVNKSHIEAIVRVGLAGPTGRPVSPDTAWHRLSWYTSDPREVEYVAGEHDDYFRRLSALSRELTRDTAQRVAYMLTIACVASVKHRYPDDTDETLPGPSVPYWTGEPTFDIHGARPLTAVEALKAIDGYEYQSCELPGWSSSEAQRFCDTLRGALISALPGYRDAATWDIAAPVHA